MISRKKPGVAFWATVVVVVALMAYPLSFGPACWLMSRTTICTNSITAIYQPVYICWMRAPERVSEWINWYCYVGAKRDWYWGKGPGWIPAVINRNYPRDWPYHMRDEIEREIEFEERAYNEAIE